MPKEQRVGTEARHTRDPAEVIVRSLMIGVEFEPIVGTSKIVDNIGNYVGTVFAPTKDKWNNMKNIKKTWSVSKPLAQGDVRAKELFAKVTRNSIGDVETTNAWMGFLEKSLVSADITAATDIQKSYLVLWSFTYLVYRLALRYCSGETHCCSIDKETSSRMQKYFKPFEHWAKGDRKNEPWGKLVAFVMMTDSTDGHILIDCTSFLDKTILDQFKKEIDEEKVSTRVRSNADNKSIHFGIE